METRLSSTTGSSTRLLLVPYISSCAPQRVPARRQELITVMNHLVPVENMRVERQAAGDRDTFCMPRLRLPERRAAGERHLYWVFQRE